MIIGSPAVGFGNKAVMPGSPDPGPRCSQIGFGFAHYVSSPRGYVFVGGYWDYLVGRRGVLFAPVFFNAAVYSAPASTTRQPRSSIRRVRRSTLCPAELLQLLLRRLLRRRLCRLWLLFVICVPIQPLRLRSDFAHQSWEHRGNSGWKHRFKQPSWFVAIIRTPDRHAPWRPRTRCSPRGEFNEQRPCRSHVAQPTGQASGHCAAISAGDQGRATRIRTAWTRRPEIWCGSTTVGSQNPAGTS